MVEEIMKKNIGKLSRQPKDREEFKELVKYLNNLCIKQLLKLSTKSIPNYTSTEKDK